MSIRATWKVRCPLCLNVFTVEKLGSIKHEHKDCGETVVLEQEHVIEYHEHGEDYNKKKWSRYHSTPRARLDRINQTNAATHLSTRGRKVTKTGRKTCPFCNASILAYNQRCPECEHVFTEVDPDRPVQTDGKELL